MKVRPVDRSNIIETVSEYDKFHRCTRKKPFSNAEKAFVAMESLKQTTYYKQSKRPLEVYKCMYCHEFHFGHGKIKPEGNEN